MPISVTRMTILLVCGSLVAGCEVPPETLYWQTGMTPAQQQRDQTNCRVNAANSVPVNTQIGTTPTYSTPVQTNCYNTGYSVSCQSTGGQVYGGNAYSYDANSRLRANVVQQCMADRGYQLISFPVCTDEERSGGEVLVGNSRLPSANRVRCLTENGYVPL